MAVLLPTAQAGAPAVSEPYVNPEQPKDATIQLKVEKLIECESGGKNVVILDTNGLHSYGILQFQKATFISYMKRYALAPRAEQKELENFLQDSEIQRELAYRMLEEDPKNVRHWYNCAKAKGIYE